MVGVSCVVGMVCLFISFDAYPEARAVFSLTLHQDVVQLHPTMSPQRFNDTEAEQIRDPDVQVAGWVYRFDSAG